MFPHLKDFEVFWLDVVPFMGVASLIYARVFVSLCKEMWDL